VISPEVGSSNKFKHLKNVDFPDPLDPTTTTTSAKTVSYSTGASTHTVQAGDTLFRIAKNNGLTLSELKALNGLTSNNIRVGQVLKVSK